jgi:hypothetical protein
MCGWFNDAIARASCSATQAVGVSRERLRKNLDRYVPPETRITRLPHLAHASGTDRRDNFIRTEASARLEDHGCVELYAFVR